MENGCRIFLVKDQILIFVLFGEHKVGVEHEPVSNGIYYVEEKVLKQRLITVNECVCLPLTGI